MMHETQAFYSKKILEYNKSVEMMRKHRSISPERSLSPEDNAVIQPKEQILDSKSEMEQRVKLMIGSI